MKWFNQDDPNNFGLYRAIDPLNPRVVPCRTCGCTLSRVRHISNFWLTKFFDRAMPQWAWDRLRSRCRKCGDDGRDRWVERQGFFS